MTNITDAYHTMLAPFYGEFRLRKTALRFKRFSLVKRGGLKRGKMMVTPSTACTKERQGKRGQCLILKIA